MPTKPQLAIAKRSLAEAASDTLRDAILSGSLPPGKRLVETDLAYEMGVSRGTVRAALSDLKRDGLVASQPYSSWAVTELDAQTLWEIYTLRASLESGAAYLMAQSISPKDIEAIRAAEKQLAKAEETGKKRLEADLAFHALFVERCGNRMLQESYAIIADKLRWAYVASEAVEPERIDLVKWHEPLIAALCAGQADTAARLVFDMCMASLEQDLKAIPDIHSLRSNR